MFNNSASVQIFTETSFDAATSKRHQKSKKKIIKKRDTLNGDFSGTILSVSKSAGNLMNEEQETIEYFPLVSYIMTAVVRRIT